MELIERMNNMERNTDYSPMVSVIVPVYNTSSLLLECLLSICNQTYNNLEIIVVDDGAFDASSSILDRVSFDEDRLIIIHKTNGGQGLARNLGTLLASGKYIIYLDSDDYWAPNTIEYLCMEAEASDLDVVVFSANIVYDSIQSYNSSTPLEYLHNNYHDVIDNGTNSFFMSSEFREYFSQPCMRFYLLDYIKQLNLSFDEDIIHEDENFSFFAYIFARRIKVVNDKLYFRRYREGSTMTDGNIRKSIHGKSVSLKRLIHYYLDNNSMLNPQQRKAFIYKIREMAEALRYMYDSSVSLERKNNKPVIGSEYIFKEMKSSLILTVKIRNMSLFKYFMYATFPKATHWFYIFRSKLCN